MRTKHQHSFSVLVHWSDVSERQLMGTLKPAMDSSSCDVTVALIEGTNALLMVTSCKSQRFRPNIQVIFMNRHWGTARPPMQNLQSLLALGVRRMKLYATHVNRSSKVSPPHA